MNSAYYTNFMTYAKYLGEKPLLCILMSLEAKLPCSFAPLSSIGTCLAGFRLAAGFSLLIGLFLFQAACSAEAEKPEEEQIGDLNLQNYAWEGWARIDTCYYHEPNAIVYRSCPEEAAAAQKYLTDRKYNAKLNVEAAGASSLALALAYSPNEIPDYMIQLPSYSRSTDSYVHEDVRIPILTFDAAGAVISSEDIIDMSDIILEQQPETLSGGMSLRLSKYPTIEVLVPDPTRGIFIMQPFDLYFIFSLFLRKTEK